MSGEQAFGLAVAILILGYLIVLLVREGESS
jgi:hypothetical protein